MEYIMHYIELIGIILICAFGWELRMIIWDIFSPDEENDSMLLSKEPIEKKVRFFLITFCVLVLVIAILEIIFGKWLFGNMP